MLFEINLDYNTWVNIGYLIKREKEKALRDYDAVHDVEYD